MRKKILILSILLAVSLVLTGCITIDMGSGRARSMRGNGDLVTEERTVSGIEKVALYGIGEVEVTTGEKESLIIQAEENLLEYLTSDVDSGTLELRTRNFYNLQPTKPIRYQVTVKSVEGLEIFGSGNITLDYTDTESMRLVIAGSGDITVGELMADSLTVTIPGSGTVRISGEVSRQNINVAGSGKYMAEDLQSQSADVNLAGSGDIRIWVTDALDIRILGSGDIRYYGLPSLSQTILGSGNITSLGEK